MEPLLLALTQKAPDPETLQLAVSYSRIILPVQLCFFVGALLTALQHYHMRFFLPALSGLIYNGAIILGGYLGRSSGLEGFAWGVFGGAFVGHFLLQGWGVLTLPKEAFHKSAKPSKAVRRYFWSFRFTDPLFIRYLKLTLPLVVGVGPLFALEFLYRSYGPIFGTGGIAQLGYAYRIMYTVVSVFGFSVGVASYPYLAKLAKQGEHQAIQNLLFTNLGRIFSLLSPVLLILWFAAEPITQTLFERGAFSPEASRQVALLLQGFLMASIGMSSHVLIVRCFYAYEKMWLPALLTSGVVLATLPLYDWLAATLGIQGIPIAASISTSVMVLVLFATWMYIQRSQNVKGLHTFLVESLKVLFCFIVSFGILHFLFIQIESVGWKSVSLFQKGPTSLWKNALQLGLFSAVIFLGQFTLQRVFRVHAAKDLTQRLFKKWF
jgi:putative peptidoglycan lipid II flippase